MRLHLFLALHATVLFLVLHAIAEFSSADKGNGLSIDGAFNNRGGEVFLDLTLRNLSEVVLANFAMSVNKNP